MSLIIPPWIIPREESHQWLDELSTVFQPEFAPGASQRQSYGSMRLKIDRSHTVRGEELAVLESTLLAADGRSALVYARAPHRLMTGTLPTSELITNSTFASGTTGFTSTTGEVLLSVSSRTLRALRDSVVGLADIRLSSITVGTSTVDRYVFRIMIRAGRGAINLSIRFGTSASGAEISSTSLTDAGFYEMVLTSLPSTTLHISIRDNVAGRSAGDYYDIPYVSLSKALTVDGASQTGSVLTVEGGVLSSNGVLMPGDWVGVGRQVLIAGCELVQLTQALSINSSASGYLKFKPQLFRSSGNDSPVVCFQPFGKFLVSDLKIKNRLGVEADVSYTLEQVYD